MCSQKFRKIKESYLLDKVHRETPVPKSLFNKVAGLRPATSLKKKFWHRCSALNFEKFLRTPLLQNTSRRLLLETLDTRLSSARTKERDSFLPPWVCDFENHSNQEFYNMSRQKTIRVLIYVTEQIKVINIRCSYVIIAINRSSRRRRS